MSGRTLSLVAIAMLLVAGSAFADSASPTQTAKAVEADSMESIHSAIQPTDADGGIAGTCSEAAFVRDVFPVDEEEPVEACKDAERNTCNCNTDADCDARCGKGKCHCLIALDCSAFPCVGSCRPWSYRTDPTDRVAPAD